MCQQGSPIHTCMGYGPSLRSRWLDMFMGQDGVKVYKLTRKEWGQYPVILTKQAWSIMDLLCGFQGNFSCRTKQAVPSRQDCNQSQCRIWFILPTHRASHIPHIQSTLTLQTPRYYGCLLLRTTFRSLAKAEEIWLEMTLAIADTRYYEITDTFVVPKWQFIVLTLDKADTTYFSYNIIM